MAACNGKWGKWGHHITYVFQCVHHITCSHSENITSHHTANLTAQQQHSTAQHTQQIENNILIRNIIITKSYFDILFKLTYSIVWYKRIGQI